MEFTLAKTKHMQQFLRVIISWGGMSKLFWSRVINYIEILEEIITRESNIGVDFKTEKYKEKENCLTSTKMDKHWALRCLENFKMESSKVKEFYKSAMWSVIKVVCAYNKVNLLMESGKDQGNW